MTSEKYRRHAVMCYVRDGDVMEWMKEYAKENYLSFSKVAFFALKEKYEREQGLKTDLQGPKVSTPAAQSAPTPKTLLTASDTAGLMVTANADEAAEEVIDVNG